MDDISIAMIVVTLWETLGWLFVAATVIGLVLLVLLVIGLLRARSHGLSAFGLFLRGVAVMLIAAAIITPLVPVWTLAPVGNLRGMVDVVIAYSMALAPASILGVLWVYFGSMRGAKA